MTVDVSAPRSYVASVMRVLLFLSVLLSALTGVGASARAPGVAQAVAGRSVQALAVVPAKHAAQARQPADLPGLRAVASISATPLAVGTAEPLWANRRRE